MKYKLRLFVAMPLIFLSCKGNTNRGMNAIQHNLDSACFYYDAAIKDIKLGVPKSEILHRYSERTIYFHKTVSKEIDSLTNEVDSKRLTPDEYDGIIHAINTDSVSNKVEELKKLGLELPIR